MLYPWTSADELGGDAVQPGPASAKAWRQEWGYELLTEQLRERVHRKVPSAAGQGELVGGLGL
jgi:hypothetical protein